MQEDRKKNNPPQPTGNQKAGGNRDAVEKCVNDQANKNRVALMGVNELVFVGFFSEMEMSGYCVLEEMNDQIPHQNQRGGALAAQLEGSRENFDDGSSQHEARA